MHILNILCATLISILFSLMTPLYLVGRDAMFEAVPHGVAVLKTPSVSLLRAVSFSL